MGHINEHPIALLHFSLKLAKKPLGTNWGGQVPKGRETY